MTNIDLKDAYLSVPVHESSQKFLRFVWQGKLSVQSSPIWPVFVPQNIHEITETRCSLSKKETHSSAHIPGRFSSVGSTKEEAIKHSQLLIVLHRSIVFTINLRKSFLSPTQIITFLSINIDSLSVVISLPVAKVHKILDCFHHLATSPTAHYHI